MATATLLAAATSPALAALMKNYANYNLWANTTLLQWLKAKPAAMLEQTIASSFPSIRLTLVHMMETEQYWLSILKGEAQQRKDTFIGTLPELFAALLKTSAALATLVNNMKAEGVEERSLIESPWFRCNFPNFEYIMHCANHSTYHRGQVVTMGRQLGFTDAPMTDYNLYNIDERQVA